MNEVTKQCPQCKSPYAYLLHTTMYSCPECSHEWNSAETSGDENQSEQLVVKDMNGTVLHDGDTVLFMKDMSVKGYSKPLKSGTKVKNIHLTDGDHNIDCKIPGFGAMELKSELVKKVIL
ncbi:MAG: alkylphosphonate utilization protein [Candidatus Magasanikbacteria bacterium]|jgi:protein PhnA|nr:alkylphosphonate utilization protein [Candidatus Magasanikbacteria bacterium]MBT4314852.1 alkylphosphonate utilization protein [Candidatus Magasanikbacteria bacterium]MBT4546761.1 alkylphosphonate utilization protein [Candidatus Magasanikbacteria bacterium]MBT6819630.1 alkylphosphonate utilization protein [Candidatus Magasanikbacteria bacterium]